MTAQMVIIVAALLVGGGGLGGIAYYDGVFATPLSQINESMVNKTITVKGVVEAAVYIGPWAFSFNFGMWGGGKGISGSGGNNTWFLLRDRDDSTQAFAMVLQGGKPPEEGKPYVVTGKLVYFKSESGDNSTFNIACIVADSFHKPLIFG